MKLKALSIVSFTFLLICAAHGQAPKTTWHGMRTLPIEGKGWEDTKDYYDRLQARAEKMVRPPVWNLSLDSAGMCARFVTDADSISAKWILRKETLSMPHMPASSCSLNLILGAKFRICDLRKVCGRSKYQIWGVRTVC